MGFGNRLKEILKEKNMTIKELSEKSGISINTLYSITKRDTQYPSHEIIQKITAVLDIDDNSLLCFEDLCQELDENFKKIRDTEIELRKKLSEISEMLNVFALTELLDDAIDKLQHNEYRVITYKKTHLDNQD